MAALRVLEFVRFFDGVWNLPVAEVEGLRHRWPDVHFDAAADAAEADRLLPDADIVLGWAVTPENFASARRLRWVHVTAAGVGSLLFPEMVESDVLVSNSRGLHAVSMAEHTLGVMLAFARKLHSSRDAQLQHRWIQDALWTEPPEFASLEGATLGIVGLGHVGSALAARARALGMHVIAIRRRPQADPAPAHVQWGVERLDDLLRASDYVVLAAPLTAQTRGLIGATQLACMNPQAVLINIGRGALVDEPALIDALEHGRIAGAGLDVTREEPLPEASPLWSMPHVILTPHISGLGTRYWERAVAMFEAHLRAFRDGLPLPNQVDKRAGY